MRRALTRLKGDGKGVTIIEFAFVAPLLVLFILGITDAARAVSAKLTIDQAASRAIEKIAVGTVQTDYTFAQTEAATAAGVPTSQVTVTSWLECDGTRQPNFTDSCTSGQQTARYVKIAITKNFVPSFGYGKYFLSADSSGNVAMSTEESIRIQ
jgi:Flp pilus assembly protein TadG